jgi:acyl-homoserine lactone synthase
MIDVHVVTCSNRALYADELDSFFRWRHRIYVDERRWREPSPDGRERDQFDTAAATYLLGLDEGELVAGSRLIPTSRPHLLSEVFPHLCAVRGVLRAPDVAEWTRMFVVPGRRERAGHEVAGEMCCALMEYALAEGIRQFGGIQETYFLTRWQHYGWHVTPLGLPEEVDGTWSVAAYFDATEEALEGVRRAIGIHGSLVVRRGFPKPFVSEEDREVAGRRRAA